MSPLLLMLLSLVKPPLLIQFVACSLCQGTTRPINIILTVYVCKLSKRLWVFVETSTHVLSLSVLTGPVRRV